MSKSKKLTKEDVLHLAKLSALLLDDDEVSRFEGQLTETLGYIENLQELDTTNVKGTNQTIELFNVGFDDGTPNERQLTHEQTIANAKTVRKSNFVVKRIIEV